MTDLAPSFSWDVFVSYSSKDQEFVREVVADLEAHSVRVWWDEKAIRPAERIREAINQGIQESASVLVFISPRSLASRWVLNELDTAMLKEMERRQAVVIPILLGRVDIAELPGDLRGKKFIDLRGNKRAKYHTVRDGLMSAIAIASSRPELAPDRTFVVGDDLVRFFHNYRKVHLDPGKRVGEAGVNSFADAVTEVLEDYFDALDDPDTMKTSRDQFVARYGLVGLRSMILFRLDKLEVDLATHFTQDDVDEAMAFVTLMLRLFSLQRTLVAHTPVGIVAGLDYNEDLMFALRGVEFMTS